MNSTFSFRIPRSKRFIVLGVFILVLLLVWRLSDRSKIGKSTDKSLVVHQLVSIKAKVEGTTNAQHVETFIKQQDKLETSSVDLQSPWQPRYQYVIHLDFKGMPPKKEYLMKMLPLIKDFGGTALLMEYENMFPYEGDLKVVTKSHAYKKEDIELFIKTAENLGLEVIPLVPSFGHLEFLTIEMPFIDLREVHLDLSTLCPSNNRSLPTVQSMIDNILSVHKNVKYIHIGGDEVTQIKKCDICTASDLNEKELYLSHMVPLLKYIRTSTTNQITPIIWDDMLRDWTVEELKPLSGLTDLMIWGYRKVEMKRINSDTLQRYSEVFPNIWGAGAFKGANDHSSDLVYIQPRIDNIFDWMKLLDTMLPKSVNIRGFVLTGWSKFNSLHDLCETFPVAVPSLALCLQVLHHQKFNNDIHKYVSKKLGFQDLINLETSTADDNYSQEDCNYLGCEVLNLNLKIKRAQFNIKDAIKNFECLKPDYVGDKSQCAATMETVEKSRDVLQLATNELSELENVTRSTLEKYFYNYSIEKWMTRRITYPYRAAKYELGNANYILRKNKKN